MLDSMTFESSCPVDPVLQRLVSGTEPLSLIKIKSNCLKTLNRKNVPIEHARIVTESTRFMYSKR